MRKLLLFAIMLLFISCEQKKETRKVDKIAFQVKSTTTECGFEDGSYTAKVDYNNARTGHTATYTLDVDVVNCEVVQINFPNGGYVDEDHITAATIDNEGNAIVEGEKGKTYGIQLEN